MSWRTQTGRRQDLEILEVNAPFGYIGERIYPTLKLNKTSGTIFYKPTPPAIGTITENRNRQTGTITRNFSASANVTYSVAEKIYRHSISKLETDNFDGIAQIDEVGGKAAKRGCMQKLELLRAGKLYTGTAHDVTAGAFLDAVAAGAEAVRHNDGKTALILSNDRYKKLIKTDEVLDRLKFTGFSFAAPEQILSVKTEVLLSMLQNLCGVDEILIGDDDVYNVSDYAGFAAVVKLPEPGDNSYKLYSQLGRTVTYLCGDSSTPFEIESDSDNDLKVNDYDATAMVDIVEFNNSAKYILNFPAATTPTTEPETGTGTEG